uniref:NADH-ubiquinone oxidoreductase chain 4L n=1 Tax=Nesiohelix kanoi TaxID=244845 RepID=Q75YP2_9EUPU|nr:NADH dehydrogenase subunit 4L [Nesiohelix kanoi]
MSYKVFLWFLVLIILMCFLILVNKKRLLMNLVSLEVLMYMIIFAYYPVMLVLFNSMTYFIVMLCFAASGAALGLSLLISMGRLYGNDYVKSLS